jgi:hypothetical protein
LIGAEGLLVNELACRIGGAFEDVFIPWLCGFDILQAVIQGALGQAIKPPPADWRMETTPRQVFVSLMFARPGRIAQMTPAEALKALPFVLDAGYNYTAGQVLPAVQNATARLGHCVMVSADGRIDRCLQDFNRTLSVRDAEGRELALPVFSAPKHTGAQSETR